MSQKKTVILLIFSLCLNLGCLITALLGYRPTPLHGQRYPAAALSRHIELLKGLDLPPETFQRAKEYLDAFMDKRADLIAEKLSLKIETIAMLRDTPLMSRKELEARYQKEADINGVISELGIEYTLSMRGLLPPDKLKKLYINAEALIQAHREKIIQLKKITD